MRPVSSLFPARITHCVIILIAVVRASILAPLPAQAQGELVAWGAHIVVDLAELSELVAVAGGESHSLALKTDGSIVAWGRSGQGQLDVPAPNTNFVEIAAGGWHNLALKSDGSVVAWGQNNSGQTDVPAPNTNFTAVEAGRYHSLALKTDGSISAWGDNAWG